MLKPGDFVGPYEIRGFVGQGGMGQVYRAWGENSGSPKRNLRALAIIAEVIHNLDIVAIQEVRQDGVRIRASRAGHGARCLPIRSMMRRRASKTSMRAAPGSSF